MSSADRADGSGTTDPRFAKVDGVPVAVEIRSAVGDLIAEPRNNAEFPKRLRQSLAGNQEIPDRLAQTGRGRPGHSRNPP